MFLSRLFADAFANTVGVVVELYNTDGARGAARGAGIGAGIFGSYEDAFAGLEKKMMIEPNEEHVKSYADAYGQWRGVLENRLKAR